MKREPTMANVEIFDGMFPESHSSTAHVKDEDVLLEEFLDARFYDTLSPGHGREDDEDMFEGFDNSKENAEQLFQSVKDVYRQEYPFNSYIEDDTMLGLPQDDEVNSSSSALNQREPITPQMSGSQDISALQLLQQPKDEESEKRQVIGVPELKSEEFVIYEQSRDELMKLKFGATKPNMITPDHGFDFVSELTTPIPQEYFAVDQDSLPYKLAIGDFPSCSRVETQIKLRLTISPAPPQFLIHLPSNTIAKSKLCLSAPVPESMQPHLLYLDTYVTSSGAPADALTPDSTNGLSPNISPSSMKSCNACVRCLRREMKRAARRKTGNIEDGLNWSPNEPKRAVIFNCKEIISFPRPTGFDSSNSARSEKSIEIMSRIICYCRHHSERDGFRLLFVLKNHKGEILGRTFSNSVMIMDRKKAGNSGGTKATVSDKHYNSSSGKEKISIKTESRPLSPTSIDDSSASEVVQLQPNKRQKRPWSPEPGTYYDSVSQQRSSNRTESVSSSRKDPISPASSDVLSPHQHLSSATSVFTTTPDRNTSFTGLSSASFASKQRRQVSASQPPVTATASSDIPMIQRIIPAQGPIRGGIEVTLLGCNFRPGLNVKFGANVALATHCWSESTMVTYLPPASQAGPVLVTFSEDREDSSDVLAAEEPVSTEGAVPQLLFTYLDDTDRQLIELALQIVGLKMNGKLEDAKNIAKRIIGNNNSASGSPSNSPAVSSETQQANDGHDEWLEQATHTVQKLTQSNLGQEEILLKFLALIDLPNSPVSTPNWAICTTEGQTLLHLACMKGYLQLVLFLINRGSRVDFTDGNDFTPLHFALLNGQREIIEVLIKCKAKLSTKLSSSVTIRDIADSNVLDLIGNYYAISENETENSEDREFRELNRRMSFDSLGSLLSNENDNGMRCHISRMIEEAESKSTTVNTEAYSYDDDLHDDSSDFADEENDDDDDGALDSDSSSELSPVNRSTVVASTSEPRRSTNLWQKVRKAFTDGEQEEEEDLPTYDDLFPPGASLKSLFGKKAVTDERSPHHTIALSPAEALDSSEESAKEDMMYNLLSSSNRKPVANDKRLLFFWFPLLLALMLVVLASKFNMVNEEYWESTIVAEFMRAAMGKFVYGKERFEEMFADRFNALPIGGM